MTIMSGNAAAQTTTDTNLRQIIVGHANTFHDPAIAILEGDQVYAEGIERHIQCKRAWENLRLWYSWRDIRNALDTLGLWPVKDASVVSVSSWDLELLKEVEEERLAEFAGPQGISIMMHQLSLEPLFSKQLGWILRSYPPHPHDQPHESSPGVFKDELNISIQAKMLNHHLGHAALAVYTSPFEECVVMVIDGFGEGTTTSFYHFKENRFQLIHQQGISSLGVLYAFITDLCGFNHLEGEEWKIMGLAAYGSFREDLYRFFMDHIEIDGLQFDLTYDPGDFFSKLGPMIGGFRHPDDADIMQVADLAHNFQRAFEETVIALAKAAGELGLSENLAYAGGCALNSSANGKILENTTFERLHIPSAPADDGNALGGVLYEKYCVQGDSRTTGVMSPYLGTMVNIPKLQWILDFKGVRYRKFSDERDLCEETAALLAEGKIVGWMQGRAEFGPRALGNRSILADPRPADMKDKINARVKFRESYRPLAPSILHEFGEEYFENYQESPYMERTLLYRKEVRDKVPAVVHENGTGRLQTVKEEWNPLYYHLIRSFYEKTGIPLLLNTSFNVMGKPIVHSVEDAITVFFTTGLDYAVIGNYILMKDNGEAHKLVAG